VEGAEQLPHDAYVYAIRDEAAYPSARLSERRRENGHRGPTSMRHHRENGAHGPTLVRQPAGRRLSESGPPQVSGALPGQVR
jgi:hypothetical protein